MVDEHGEEVVHLCCSECDDNVTVAQLDDEPHLVCHCTHVDGEIDPVWLYNAGLPSRWSWVSEGVSPVPEESDGTVHRCPECDREFQVEWTGPTELHHAKTRYCPRCGERL